MDMEIETDPRHLIEKFEPIFIPFNDLKNENSAEGNFVWFGESQPGFFDGVYGLLISVNTVKNNEIQFYHGVFKSGIFKGLLNLRGEEKLGEFHLKTHIKEYQLLYSAKENYKREYEFK
jgi:hypothetical protein